MRKFASYTVTQLSLSAILTNWYSSRMLFLFKYHGFR